MEDIINYVNNTDDIKDDQDAISYIQYLESKYGYVQLTDSIRNVYTNFINFQNEDSEITDLNNYLIEEYISEEKMRSRNEFLKYQLEQLTRYCKENELLIRNPSDIKTQQDAIDFYDYLMITYYTKDVEYYTTIYFGSEIPGKSGIDLINLINDYIIANFTNLPDDLDPENCTEDESEQYNKNQEIISKLTNMYNSLSSDK